MPSGSGRPSRKPRKMFRENPRHKHEARFFKCDSAFCGYYDDKTFYSITIHSQACSDKNEGENCK